MKEKRIVIAGSQGERGDASSEYALPVGGVVRYTGSDTPEGFVTIPTPESITTPLKTVDARLDVLEGLPEGSTTGDAETADIRVGYDGEKYQSAGEAVRDQISDLHDYAEEQDAIQDANIDVMTVHGEAEGTYLTLQDAASLPAEQYALTLSPVQSLNGYDSPWVGGAGDSQFGYGIGAPDVSGTYNGWAITYNTNARLVLFDNDTTADISGLYFGFTVNGSDSSGGQVYWAVENGTEVDRNLLTTFHHYISIYPKTQASLDKLFARYKVMCVVDNHGYSEYIPYQNICPIHGADEVGVRVRGKNQFNINASQTTTYGSGVVDGNKITVTGQYYCYLNNFIKAGTYRVSFTVDSYTSARGIRFQFVDGTLSDTQYSNFTITTTKDIKGVLLYAGQGTSGTTVYENIQIERNETATEYAPFVEHSTTITLPSTVYGGSVEQGGSGEKTYLCLDFDGSMDETWAKRGDGSAAAFAMQIEVDDIINFPDTSKRPPIKTNYLPTVLHEETWGNFDAFICAEVGGKTRFITGIKTITTVEDWRAYLAQNPLQICFELATPTALSVTPFPQTLLEGVNNVWAECSEDGAVIADAEQALSYQRDTTLIINNLINRIEELERRNHEIT